MATSSMTPRYTTGTCRSIPAKLIGRKQLEQLRDAIAIGRQAKNDDDVVS
jgi:hypothetical protein